MHKLSIVLAFLAATVVSGTYIPRAPQGTQFITGPCSSDADCASGCCGFRTGKCAGAIVALERDGGCGFGNAQPNDDAARRLRGQAPAAPAPPANNNGGGALTVNAGDTCSSIAAAAGVNVAALIAANPGVNAGCTNLQVGQTLNRPGAGGAPAPPAAAPPARAPGTQFITGPCGSDADCASGCCGFRTGKCAGAIIALERDGGCGFGNAQPNDDAARRLRGQA